MDKFKSSVLKYEKKHELLLGVLFIAYILSNIQSPMWITLNIHNNYSKFLLFLFVLSLFYAVSPMVAVLGLFAVVELVKRSKLDDKFNLANQIPAEDTRTYEMLKMNQFPNTLEEEMVNNMEPLVNKNTYLGTPSYKPVLEDDGNATLLNSE